MCVCVSEPGRLWLRYSLRGKPPYCACIFEWLYACLSVWKKNWRKTPNSFILSHLNNRYFFLMKMELGQTMHVIIHLCIFCTQDFLLFFLQIICCQWLCQTVDLDLLILSVTLTAVICQTQHPLLLIIFFIKHGYLRYTVTRVCSSAKS